MNVSGGKIKFRKQLYPNSCGHAVLQMILESFYEEKHNQKMLINKIPLTNEGISLNEMSNYLSNKNITLESFASKNKNDIEFIPFNKSLVILVLKEGGLIHFVLVEKRRFNKILVHDPAREKSIWISLEEIKSKWVNIFAFVSLDKAPSIGSNINELSAYFVKQSKPSKWIMSLFFILSLVSGFTTLLIGYQFRTLISVGVPSGSNLVLVFISMYFLFAILLQKSISYFMDRVAERDYQVKLSRFYKILAKKSNYITSPNENRVAVLNSFPDLASFLYWNNKMQMIFPFKLLTALGSVIGLAYINWIMSIIVLALFLLLGLFSLIYKKKLVRKRQDIIEKTNVSSIKLGLWIENLETNILSGLNFAISRDATIEYDKISRANSSIRFMASEFGLLSTIIISITSLIIYFVGSYLLIKKNTSLEELVAIISLSISFWSHVSISIQCWINQPKNDFVFKNLNSLKFDAKNKVNSLHKINHLSISDKKIKIEVEKGDCILFSGSSGTGKTTLLKNIYYSRKCKWNDSTNLCPKKNKMLFLNHVPIIIEGTVESNLLLSQDSRSSSWNKSKCTYDIEALLRSANIEPQRRVSINGTNLSQGQKQIINITRILTRNDEIVILDEAFNSISEDFRKQLFTIIKSYCENKILLVASHDKYIFNQIPRKIRIG